ncbi:ATP-binding protein [Ferrimonas futtsuensis]|uniref:ATP-binding protein n=1 Tax=Ferrimonas futtsuensis TaxID=364764 RepID=UPI000A0071C5|nr:ATP-binding protein [Ferrimonas futtsuensis]
MAKCITLRGEAGYSEVSMMAKAVAAIYQLSSLLAKDACLVELAVVEVGNNIVEHAYGDKPGGLLELRYLQSDSAIEIVLVDEGAPMSQETQARVACAELQPMDPGDPATWTISGRGLGIVNEVMDGQSYRREGNRNYFRMVKRVPG